MELTIEQAFQIAINAHRQGRLHEAESLYRQILKANPLHADANHNLGRIAMTMNKKEAALTLFKNALVINPNQSQFWISYIDALIKSFQYESAKYFLHEAIKRGITGGVITQLKNIINTEVPDVSDEKNQNLSEKLIPLNPDQNQITTLLDHYKKGDYQIAEELALSLTIKYPEHQFTWKVLALIKRQLGKLFESLTAMQKAVELLPNDYEAFNNLGNILKEIGERENARISYLKAIELNSGYAESHYNLGVILVELDKTDEAEKSYERALAIKPDFAQAHNNLGNIYKSNENFSLAEKCFRRAIELVPNYAEALNNLGHTLHSVGKFHDAEQCFQTALTLNPKYPEAFNNLGCMFKELGKLKEAERNFQKAISLKSDYADAYYNLGVLAQDLDQIDNAYLYFEQTLQHNPDFHRAILAIGKLDLKKNMHKEGLIKIKKGAGSICFDFNNGLQIKGKGRE